MGSVTTKDGVDTFDEYWGSGQPVVLSHGWPMTSDARDRQLEQVARYIGRHGAARVGTAVLSGPSRP